MTKIAIAVVIIAMVYCIQALPRPQFNPWSNWNGFPNIPNQMNQMLSKMRSDIANSQKQFMENGANGVNVANGANGNGMMVSSYSSSSKAGPGNQETLITRTVQRSGQPAQTEVIHAVNGKVEKYNLTDTNTKNTK